MEIHQQVLERCITMRAYEIFDNVLDQTFRVCVSNVSKHVVKLPNNTVM